MSRIRYIFLLIVLLIPASASSKYGIMTFDGKIITPAIYDRVDNRGIVFGEKHLVVEKNGYKGIVGENGKQLGEVKYDYASIFSRPLYEVRKNKKCGFLNKEGKESIPCIYDSYVTTDDIDEWYCVRLGDKYGMVDSNNKVIFPFEYSDLDYYNDKPTTSISVQKEEDGKWALANRKAEIVTPYVYDKIELFPNGGGLAERDSKFLFLSSTGKEIASTDYRDKDNIKDRNYFVGVVSKKDGSPDKYVTLYTHAGDEIRSYKGYNIFYFSDGIGEIRTNDGYSLIDTLGQLINHVNVNASSGRELYGLNFCNGRAVANKSGKQGIIDVKGKAVVPFTFSKLDLLLGAWTDGQHYVVRDSRFVEGLLIVDENGKQKSGPVKYKGLFGYEPFFIKGTSVETGQQGVISFDGDELTPFIYDEVVSANNYLATLKLDDKIGFFNVLTKAKIDPVFDEWQYPHFGKCIIVEKDGYEGVINTDCKVVLECIYSDIEKTPNGYIIATDNEGRSAIFDEDGNIVRPFGEETLYYFNDNLLVFYIDNED